MAGTPQNDRLNNITLEDINSSLVDTVSKSSEIMLRVVNNPIAWNGRSFQWPVITSNSSLGQSFKGTETFDTTIDANWPAAVIYPTGYAQPVGVSVVERSINATPAGVLDLYRSSYEYAQNSMITALGSIFYGFGSGSDFDGLGNIIDDGTTTTSYAGLTRATYPTINAKLTAAAAGVLDLATMASTIDGATISGNLSETPNVALSNQTVWSLFDALLEPTSQALYNSLGNQAFIDGTSNVSGQAGNNLTRQAGASNLVYRGIEFVRDQKATSGNLFFVNEHWWKFRALKLQGLDTVGTSEDVSVGAYDNYKVSAFQFRQMMMPVNQLSEVGIFVLYGDLYCLNPNRNGLISGITTT